MTEKLLTGTLSLNTTNQSSVYELKNLLKQKRVMNNTLPRRCDESQCDTSMTNIFARPIKMPDS